MEQLYFETADEWREWLQNNHDKSSGVWLEIFYEKPERSSSLRRNAAIEEALCYGWVDSSSGVHNSRSYKGIDSEKEAQAFTPMKDGSQWSVDNRKRAEKLIEENRMTNFGLAKIEAAKRLDRWYTPVTLYTEPITLLVLVALYFLGGLISFGVTSCLREPVESISVAEIFALLIIGPLVAIPVTVNISIPLMVSGLESPSAWADLAKITWVLTTISFMILGLGFGQSPYFSIGAIIVGGGILYLILIISSAVQNHKWRTQDEQRPLSRTDLWNYATQVLAIVMTTGSIAMVFFRTITDNLPWSC